MLRASGLDMQDTCTPKPIDEFVANIGLEMCTTHQTLLGSSPGAAIFDRDMLFDIPYSADWSEIGRKRQAQVDKYNIFRVGQTVVLIKDDILQG